MKILMSILFSITVALPSVAETATFSDMTIQSIRAVGDYPGSELYDETIEIHFTQPITWSSTLSCTGTDVVYVNASDSHVVSAAYTAMIAGKTVSAFTSDSAEVRGSYCTVSWLEIKN